MSDEVENIFKQNYIKILENTIPEKRAETQELLNSTTEELLASFAKLEKSLTGVLEKIPKLQQN